MVEMEIKNLYKVIKKNTILDNVSFSCSSGNIIGVIGPNGSGKSSLFKIISNLWSSTSGEVIIKYTNIDNQYKIPKLNCFIEYPNFYDKLSGYDNLNVLMKLYDITDMNWYNYLLDKFDMKKFLNKKVKNFSLGMKQKLGLVSVLINKPDVLILDEPTNSLDIDSVNALYEIINILKGEGKIILLSSHILEELDSIVDNSIIINNGSIIELYNKQDNSFKLITFENKIMKKDFDNFTHLDDIQFVDENTLKIDQSKYNELIIFLSSLNYKINNITECQSLKEFFSERLCK